MLMSRSIYFLNEVVTNDQQNSQNSKFCNRADNIMYAEVVKTKLIIIYVH